MKEEKTLWNDLQLQKKNLKKLIKTTSRSRRHYN